MELKNAQILSAKLYIEDHDILTFLITFKGKGVCGSVGGYAMDQAFRHTVNDAAIYTERYSSPAGLDCMRQIMEVVGVTSWEDLPGKYIRYESDGWGSEITTIWNIIEDKHINIKTFFKNYNLKNWYQKCVLDQEKKVKEANDKAARLQADTTEN